MDFRSIVDRRRVLPRLKGGDWPTTRRQWLINVAVGVAILIGFRRLGATVPITIIENWALDTAMSFKANVWPERHGRVPPLVSIDVDEDTWRDPEWGGGAPVQAPREGLLELIDHAVERGASYILVDVIVEGSSPEDLKFAQEIERRVQKPENKARHLLFVRTVLRETEEYPQPEWRYSALDEVIRRHPDRVHAVAPYFAVSRDGVLREWKLWEIACDRAHPVGKGSGTWRVLPSAQLAVAILAGATDPVDHAFLDNLDRRTPCGPPILEGAAAAAARLDERPSAREHERKALRHDAELAREDFESHLPEAMAQAEPGENLGSRILFSFNERTARLVTDHVSARTILHDPKDPTPMAGALVLIGQSFDEARDQHATPVGLMAGPTVLLNSVDSIIHVGLLRRMGPALDYAIEILLIILVGFVFARVRPADLAAFLLRLVLLPVFVIATYLVAEHTGRWWDYGAPLAAIGLHRSIDSIHEHVKEHLKARREHRNLRLRRSAREH